jgi:hypothetical protein
MITKICPGCGKEFKTKQCYADIPRHCARACWKETINRDRPASECEHCGMVFALAPSKVGKQKFCSKECRKAHIVQNSPAKYFECKKCGGTFKTYENFAEFCSNICKEAYNHREKQCLGCGRAFKVKPSHYDLKFYCSKECMGADYKERLQGQSNPNYRDVAPRICVGCQGEFRSQSSTRKYCSSLCYQRTNIGDFMMRWSNHQKRNGGKRDDLGGLYVRSSWEANYARYLNWLVEQGQIAKWEYEPDVFEFVTVKKGSRFYVPDFKITNLDGSIEYHEVKGWMDPKSVTKLKRMAKYYPDIVLHVIDQDVYRAVAKTMKRVIPNWE